MHYCIIVEKMPVSISLGLWTTLLAYMISIPLGVRKALLDGSSFDNWTSSLIIVGYSIPGFLFAIFLLVLFAGGSYLQLFPIRGLVSSNFENMSFFEQHSAPACVMLRLVWGWRAEGSWFRKVVESYRDNSALITLCKLGNGDEL